MEGANTQSDSSTINIVATSPLPIRMVSGSELVRSNFIQIKSITRAFVNIFTVYYSLQLFFSLLLFFLFFWLQQRFHRKKSLCVFLSINFLGSLRTLNALFTQNAKTSRVRVRKKGIKRIKSPLFLSHSLWFSFYLVFFLYKDFSMSFRLLVFPLLQL